MTRSPPRPQLFFSRDGETHDFHDTEDEARAACQAALRDYRRIAALDGEWPDPLEVSWGRIAEAVVEVASTDIDDDPQLGGRLRSVTVDYELRPVELEPAPRDLLLSAYRRYVRGIVAMSARVGDADRLRRELERTADEIERLERMLGADAYGEGGLEPVEPAEPELEEGPVRAGPAGAEGLGSPRESAPAAPVAREWMFLGGHACPAEGCGAAVEVFLRTLPPAWGDRWRCGASGHHGTIDTLPPGGRMVEVWLDGPAPDVGLTREAVEQLAAADDACAAPAETIAPAPRLVALSPELHSSSEDGHDLVDSYRRPAPKLEVIRGRR